MKFIELPVLTVVKPIDGKDETQTTYLKKLVNIAHIIDVMDDPKAGNLIHITLSTGDKMIAEGTTDKLKGKLK